MCQSNVEYFIHNELYCWLKKHDMHFLFVNGVYIIWTFSSTKTTSVFRLRLPPCHVPLTTEILRWLVKRLRSPHYTAQVVYIKKNMSPINVFVFQIYSNHYMFYPLSRESFHCYKYRQRIIFANSLIRLDGNQSPIILVRIYIYHRDLPSLQYIVIRWPKWVTVEQIRNSSEYCR